MLWDVSAIKGFTIAGSDGPVGTASDFLFGDENWEMRGLVVDAGCWFSRREVLIPIAALGRPDPASRELPVNLTVRQAQGCPDIAQDYPVWRQAEGDLYAYYGWEPYWAGSYYYEGPLAADFIPPSYRPEVHLQASRTRNHAKAAGDQYLRSVDEVIGYHVHANNEKIGRVADFLADEGGWDIRYVKVRTGNWINGSKVLVSPLSVCLIDWIERIVFLDIGAKVVADSSPYDPLIRADGRYKSSPLPHNGIDGVLP